MNKFIMLFVVLMFTMGCRSNSNSSNKYEDVKVQAMEEPTVIDVPEIEIKASSVQTGLARKRVNTDAHKNLSPEEIMNAERFSSFLEAPDKKPQAPKKALVEKPEPMMQMQSSIPLTWTTSTDKALSFGLQDREADAPKLREVRDKKRDGTGYIFIE